MWYNVHEGNEQCENFQDQIGCWQTDLGMEVFIGREPVNEKAGGLGVWHCEARRAGRARDKEMLWKID